jgi:hypothetical protein
MRKVQIIIIAVIGLISLALLALPANAQTQEVVSAEVDRTVITTDDSLTLSVIINWDNNDVSEPFLPALDGFEIIARTTSTSINIVNGARSSHKVYTYVLRPTKVGELVIGPISVSKNGQIYDTDPIKITVTQGNGQAPAQPATPAFPAMPGFPSISGLLNALGFTLPEELDDTVNQLNPSEVPSQLNGQDIFVEAWVDNPTPYMGEQVIHTLRMYRGADLGGTFYYKEPTFTGFWVHPQAEEIEYASRAAGRKYLMTEIQTVLFPTIIGGAIIEPATLTSPADIFSREMTVSTQPVSLDIQPLPANAPGNFNGAVGNFSIQAEVDTIDSMVNETVTLKVTISGEGNLDTLADPEWQMGPEWRAFDSQGTTDIQLQDGKLMGTRTIEQMLVPTTAGNFSIPSIQFSYFDPQTKNYQMISTQPIDITVAPDGQAEASMDSLADTPAVDAAETEVVIQPLKDAAGSRSIGSTFTQKAVYWLLWGLPLFLLVGQYGWQRRRKRLLNNPEAIRSRKAAKKAYRALVMARNEPQEANIVVGHILTTYISDKLNRSIVGLTQAELSDLLLAQGIDADLIDQVITCLSLSEMGQFAPAVQHEHEINMLDETKGLIAELEKEL